MRRTFIRTAAAARNARRAIAVAGLLALHLAAGAADPPPSCATPPHRAFDFWIGSWEVTLPDGRIAGTNRIEAVARGCALVERWEGAGGFVGTSLNWYDRDDGRWHQAWVDGTGGTLVLLGGLEGDRMVLATPPAAGDGPRQRITWTPRPDGTVRQHWESSDDAGATWRTVFDGRYAKRP